MIDSVLNQQINVPFAYPVHFTRNLFDAGQTILRDIIRQNGVPPCRALTFIDNGLAETAPHLPDVVTAWFANHRTAGIELVKAPHVMRGGEAIKNDYRLVMEIVDTILEYRLCRHSFVIAIGGGAMLDAVGFATSIVHRGLRLIRIPSTTLAQNDAGIGVKNGINLHGGKNTIGTFHPPYAVINDFALLEFLPQEHWIGGIAEAFKVALIKDGPFFEHLCEAAPQFSCRDRNAQEWMIKRCAELHLDHIRTSGDPFELGQARPLDFGHWAAHKLECMSNYTISHGEAVASGMLIDCQYACLQNWVDADVVSRLGDALHQTGFRLWHGVMDRRIGNGDLEILGGLDDFREHLGGTLCVTFPDGIGHKREESAVDRSCMIEAIHAIKSRYAEAADCPKTSVDIPLAGC